MESITALTTALPALTLVVVALLFVGVILLEVGVAVYIISGVLGFTGFNGLNISGRSNMNWDFNKIGSVYNR